MPSAPAVQVLAAAVKTAKTAAIAHPYLSVISVVIVIYLTHSYLAYSRLRHFPGPALARWTRIPWIIWHASGQVHLKLRDISETYGPLAVAAPGVLVTSDVELMRRMAAPRSTYQRNIWYMAFRFNPDKDHIGCERDGEAHTQRKMKLAPGYSGREIVGLEDKIDANIAALIKLVESSYLSVPTETKAFDLAQKIQYLTADSIGDIAFGGPIGFLQTDSDMYDYLKTSAEGFPFFNMLSLFPWLMHIMALDFVKKYLPSTKDTVGMGPIMRLAQETVEKRYPPKEGELHQDMLGSWIRHGLTKDEAMSETVLQILAGAETTATAIRMILFHIYTNPRVLSKLRAELRAARPSSPVTNAEAANLPYLQAVIKEAIRICPPITGDMLKDVPPEGDTYHRMFIPGGTVIGFSMVGMLVDKKTFGEDADTFRPERFLEGAIDDQVLQTRNAVVDAAFGHGRWRCLGKNIAQMELNKVIPEIIRAFDFTVVYPEHPFKSYNAGVQIQWDMFMRATRYEDGHLS
ncbi:cytochrome P450 [Podospora australis]|uniref:Cytochrome P450 n=1 Tax=Podospora australis TaxID=1536484 RepID=A0AAN6WLX3_9PEZI|nr:cytochrome P450 [Podospora australis]